jgi:hypothetical protein
MLAQQVDQRRIDVDLAYRVFGLGLELPTIPDRAPHVDHPIVEIEVIECSPAASPIRMPVPASKANRMRY